MEEYIKAWFLLKVFSKEFGLQVRQTASSSISASDMIWQAFSPRRSIRFFKYNEECGGQRSVRRSCERHLLDNVDKFESDKRRYRGDRTGDLLNYVTISTLHGYPPQEIEKIAMYLITVKGFPTFYQM